MITQPTRQHALRGAQPTRPTPRAANTAEHQARLAWRLTPRDKWIIRMLHEHRVLTTPQITALAFPSIRSAQQRLRELYHWRVTDRFQPFQTHGTAPHHHVLAPAGAAVLAAEDGLDVKDLGYRHDRAMGIAHSLRLAHTIGVNQWFTALIARARHDPTTALSAWWPETRCARHFGDLVRADAYGRWRHTSPHGDPGNGREIEFFLEFDLGTEPLTKVANKLAGYAALAAATAITTPVLVWVPTARREAAARRLLIRTWNELDHPDHVPVATAAADLLDPGTPYPSPADPVWLPLRPTRDSRRCVLHHLIDAWPHLPPPNAAPTRGRDHDHSAAQHAAAPAPMPSDLPPTPDQLNRPQRGLRVRP